MFTVGYYKLGSKWFLDLPDEAEPRDPDDLERIGGFHDFLEIASAGRSFVRFSMDLEPFDGADEMVLTGTSGSNSGAYYHVQRLCGREIDLELWYDSAIYCGHNDLPSKLYIKPLNN